MRFEIMSAGRRTLILSPRRMKARLVPLAHAVTVIMISLTFAFAFPRGGDSITKNAIVYGEAEEVTFLNVLSAPVQIDNAGLTKSDSPQKLVLSITNVTNEPVTRLVLTLFYFSPSGKLNRSEDVSEPIHLGVNSNTQVSIHLLNEIKEGERLAIAIKHVVVSQGGWVIDSRDLRDSIEAKAKGRLNHVPAARYEKNPALTKAEKAELVTSSVRRILGDKLLRKYLSIKDHETIFLSPKNIDEKLIRIPGVDIIFIKPEDIQGRADREGEIFYFECDELKSEGGQVVVIISYNIKAKLNKSFTPCCGSVVFYYQKSEGKWESTGNKIYPL